MPIAGILADLAHSYSEGQDVFYRVVYTLACVKFKTIAPFFEICDKTGKSIHLLVQSWTFA
jgi:hypothetical protein